MGGFLLTMPCDSGEVITNKIYFIRGKIVLLDRDLAVLYDIETKQVEQSKQKELEQQNRKRIGYKQNGD